MSVASCEWSPQTVQGGSAPSPRQGHSITVKGDDMYIFGGSCVTKDGSSVVFYNDLYRISVNKNEVCWEKISQRGKVPCKRDGHSMCTRDGKLYLLGGRNSLDSVQCLPGLYAFTTGNNKWEEIKTEGVGPKALSPSLSRVGGALYVIGGIYQCEATDEVYMLHLNSHTWSPLKTSGTAPTPRCDHAASVVGESIYIFGGCGAKDVWYNDLYVLNTVTLTWTQPLIRGDPPLPRACHTFTAHKDKDIYVFGGINDSLKDGSIYDKVVKLSLDHMKWRRPLCAGLPAVRRHGHSAVILHSHLYVVGGVNETGELGDIRVLKLINPSQRKHVVDAILENVGEKGSDMYGTPTLTYDLTNPPYSKPALDHTPANTLSTELKMSKDLQDIQNLATESIQKAVHKLHSIYIQLERDRAEIAASRKVSEQEQTAYHEMYGRQQKELAQMLAKHKEETEKWLKFHHEQHRKEYDNIAEEKMALQRERTNLEKEKEDTKEKAKQLQSIIHQMKDAAH